MKGIIAALSAIVLLSSQAFGFNLFKDILDSTTFPIGSQAQAGTAINLRNGDPATSLMAPVAQYRMFTLSYGATKDTKTNQNFIDTAKIGLDLGWVFSQFKNSLPPEAQWLRNINIGPSYGVSAISRPGVGYPFFDVSFIFR